MAMQINLDAMETHMNIALKAASGIAPVTSRSIIVIALESALLVITHAQGLEAKLHKAPVGEAANDDALKIASLQGEVKAVRRELGVERNRYESMRNRLKAMNDVRAALKERAHGAESALRALIDQVGANRPGTNICCLCDQDLGAGYHHTRECVIGRLSLWPSPQNPLTLTEDRGSSDR